MKLILANLRPVSIASEYLHTGADHMDLIQEGTSACCRRLRNSIRRKRALYAYAAWWSRAYILRYLLEYLSADQSRHDAGPTQTLYNLKKEKAKLEREGFVPDSKLLADRLNVRERDVIEMDQRLGSWELSSTNPSARSTTAH